MDYSTRSAQTFIGLDVHKQDIVAAMELPSGGFEEKKFPNTGVGVTRLYVYQVEAHEGVLRRIDESLKEVAHSEPYREMVERLCCFRGIAWLTAIMLVAELYDLGRFSSPRALMAYLGLTPSERSSGGKENRGGITRAGNSLARRLLVEAAWHYRRGPRKGKALQERQVGQPAWVIARADAAEVRLSSRLWRLVHKGKSSAVAVVAVARELVGFIWSVMQPAPCMA